MSVKKLAVVVLAAGFGSRMKLQKPKMICEIKNKPMILRSVKVAVDVSGFETVVVIGHKSNCIKKVISEVFNVNFAYQEKQIGTGNAVLCSIPFLSNGIKDVVILSGDVPLLQAETVIDFVNYHRRNNNDITVLGTNVSNPYGFGRIMLTKDYILSNIIEEVEITKNLKKITLINTGTFCVKNMHLKKILKRVTGNNVKKEVFLTDIIREGYLAGFKLGLYVSSRYAEFTGVNTFDDLIKAEALLCDM